MGGVQQALLMASAESGDPYWSSVVLLLHGNETPLVDEKGHTLTASGSCTSSATTKKYGAGSISFDGNQDRLDTPDSTDFDFGSGDFTIEAWVRIVSTNALTAQAIVLKSQSSNVRGPFAILVPTNTTKIQFLAAKVTTSYEVNITSTTSIGTGSWAHVAAVRSGTDAFLFINGVLEGQDTISGALLQNTDNVSFGDAELGTDVSFFGFLDDVRITKGVARYTDDFTPPDAQFPDS